MGRGVEHETRRRCISGWPCARQLRRTGLLSPGIYTLTGTGTNSASIGTYVANIAVTPAGVGPPLPEPATYALMLAALGAMHFVTRRRKAPIRQLV